MTSPQDGFTPVPNKVLEHLAQIHLSGNEFKITLAIIRKTFGYGKKVDYIANSQLQTTTGLHKTVVSRCLKALEDKNIVLREKKNIGIRRDFDGWKAVTELAELQTKVDNNANNKLAELQTSPDEKLAKSSTLLAELQTKVDSCNVAQKKKETYTKESIPAGPKLSPNPFIARMQKALGYPETLKTDPIPNPAKEAMFIKKMQTRGFSYDQIFNAWQFKVKQRGEFVSMVYVNNDIGGHNAKTSFPGTHREYTEPPEDD
jgi:phage replication O-like protein O